MSNMTAVVTHRCLRVWILVAPFLCVACDRTPLLPPTCQISVTPSALDFGTVASASQATESVHLSNQGTADCHISGVGLSASSDPSLALATDTPSSLVLRLGESATLTITFSPESVAVPLERTGDLVFRTDDQVRGTVDVPLVGKVQSNCTLAVSPSAVDFGRINIDDTASISVVVSNTGRDPCEVGDVALTQGSDPQFSLGPGQTDSFTLAPGETQAIAVAFHPVDAASPHHRAGQLLFATTDANRAHVAIPLSADINVGCALTLSPSKLDFGNVILNTTVRGSITLGNDGTDACNVSRLAFASGSDAGFTLADGQLLAFTVVPGAIQTVIIQFGAFDSAPPHQKNGTFVLQTGSTRAPSAQIPLSANVDTACVEASQWIYTVDTSGMLSRFDPATLTFTDIGILNCGQSSSPNSMAVDQNAIAWVAYQDGELFKVDTSTGKCSATTFQPDQHGLKVFGMGFVFDSSTGLDTLYIAGGEMVSAQASTLATVSFPSLVVTPVGSVSAGFPELAGTGDGELWGFIPGDVSRSGEATMLRLDPASGATLEQYAYPSIYDSSSWAMKFWGGDFWIFIGNSIYRVSRATPDVIQLAVPNSGYWIVGAGVSTCAPIH